MFVGQDEWPIRGVVSRAVRVGRGNEAVRSDIVGISGVGVSTAKNCDTRGHSGFYLRDGVLTERETLYTAERPNPESSDPAIQLKIHTHTTQTHNTLPYHSMLKKGSEKELSVREKARDVYLHTYPIYIYI